jgi:hypothetical protein
MRMTDVFISHSSQDKAIADAICASLRHAGMSCWIAPDSISPGADWGRSIIEAIETSQVMVLLLTASSNESEAVKCEVERAVANRLPIIPVRTEDVRLSKSLEFFLSSAQWLNAFPPPLQEHLHRLTVAVRTLLDLRTNAPSAPRKGSSHSAYVPYEHQTTCAIQFNHDVFDFARIRNTMSALAHPKFELMEKIFRRVLLERVICVNFTIGISGTAFKVSRSVQVTPSWDALIADLSKEIDDKTLGELLQAKSPLSDEPLSMESTPRSAIESLSIVSVDRSNMTQAHIAAMFPSVRAISLGIPFIKEGSDKDRFRLTNPNGRPLFRVRAHRRAESARPLLGIFSRQGKKGDIGFATDDPEGLIAAFDGIDIRYEAAP